MPRTMKVNVLSDKIGWFGKYSGYECLPDYYPKSIDATVNIATYNFYNKVLGKFYKVQNKINSRSEDIFNEIKFSRKVSSNDASHILYLESHIHLLKNLSPRNKVFGTIHLPFSRWSPGCLELLSKMEHIILLYKEELEAFSQYIPKSKIHVIRHGVDVNFFKPGNPGEIHRNKVLFVGHFLRNFEMFFAVFKILSKDNHSKFEFHFIIPTEHRHPPILKMLMTFNNVFFHENLSDEELLKHYQNSYVLLMPLEDSGANTGIVQALATGLPIITTDVGGIRSYGGDEVFPLVENNDTQKMVELFYQYYNDIKFKNAISEKQRNFAVEKLDWLKVAQEHVNLYSSMKGI